MLIELDDNIRNKVSNFICIRLFKNRGIYKKFKPIIYQYKIREYTNEYENYLVYKKSEKEGRKLWTSVDNALEYMTVLIFSEIIFKKLGYSNRLNTYLRHLKIICAHGKINIQLTEFFKEFKCTCNTFEGSFECEAIINTIIKYGNNWWGL